MALVYLSTRDFTTAETDDGNKEMQIKVMDPTLVLYYSDTCKFCKPFIGDYRKLPRAVNVNIAMANVQDSRGFIQTENGVLTIQGLSQHTSTPITQVPTFIFYNKGRPFMEYVGTRNLQSLSKFANDMLDRIRGAGSVDNTNTTINQKGIDSYTIGAPMVNDVCYMTFDEAYSGNSVSKASGQKYKTMEDAYH